MTKIIPKDDRIRSLLERLEKDRYAETSHDIAKQFSRMKQVRELRNLEQIAIGRDEKFRKSIIVVKTPMKRKGNGFIL